VGNKNAIPPLEGASYSIKRKPESARYLVNICATNDQQKLKNESVIELLNGLLLVRAVLSCVGSGLIASK
jgi:hypothetical protein